MSRLHDGMCWIGWVRAENTGFGIKPGVYFVNRIAQAVEKQDVFGVQVSFALLCALGAQEFSGSLQALGRRVTIRGIVLLNFFDNKVTDPLRYLLAFGHRIADVFPGDILSLIHI